MSETKHDNRAAWAGRVSAAHLPYVRTGGDEPYNRVVIGKHTDDGALDWMFTTYVGFARALTSALADAFNVELHQPGTAERLAAQPEPTATLDVSDIPELQGLTPEQVEVVRLNLACWALPWDARRSSHLTTHLFVKAPSSGHSKLSPRGREVLAALQAQRATEPTEPIGYTEAAIAGLLSCTCGEQCHAHRLDTAVAEGLLDHPCDVNDTGRVVRAEVLRRFGLAAESAPATADDAPTESEPEPPEAQQSVTAPCTHCGRTTIMRLEGEPWCHECAHDCGTICDACGGPMVHDYDGAEGSLCAACAAVPYPEPEDEYVEPAPELRLSKPVAEMSSVDRIDLTGLNVEVQG